MNDGLGREDASKSVITIQYWNLNSQNISSSRTPKELPEPKYFGELLKKGVCIWLDFVAFINGCFRMSPRCWLFLTFGLVISEKSSLGIY